MRSAPRAGSRPPATVLQLLELEAGDGSAEELVHGKNPPHWGAGLLLNCGLFFFQEPGFCVQKLVQTKFLDAETQITIAAIAKRAELSRVS